MTKVFINYRRDDTQWQADRLYKALRVHLPKRNVFMDIDSIVPGDNFEARLTRSVSECDVMFALIGPDWLDLQDPTGRRLDNEQDFVRLELEAAFARGIRVVPIIVNGAALPDRAQLPDSLHKLPVSQGFEVRRVSFEHDIERMLRRLGVARRRPGAYLALGVGVAAVAAFSLWGDGVLETLRCQVNSSAPGCADALTETITERGAIQAASEHSAPTSQREDNAISRPSPPAERPSPSNFRALMGRWDFPEGNCLAPYVLRVQGDRLITTSIRWNAESTLSASEGGSITATALAPAQIAGKTYDYSIQNDRLFVRDNASGAVQEFKTCA